MLFLDPGSEWIKIRIRDKHPGSATLKWGEVEINRSRTVMITQRLNMELDLQSLFGLLYSCTHWLGPSNSPPLPRIRAYIRGRYWSAKIDDISLYPAGHYHERTVKLFPCRHIIFDPSQFSLVTTFNLTSRNLNEYISSER